MVAVCVYWCGVGGVCACGAPINLGIMCICVGSWLSLVNRGRGSCLVGGLCCALICCEYAGECSSGLVWCFWWWPWEPLQVGAETNSESGFLKVKVGRVKVA